MSTKDISDRQVCEAYRDFLDGERRGPWPYELLQARTGQCFKVCWRAMERACERNLVEFGVNLRSGWLTPEGRALLQAATA